MNTFSAIFEKLYANRRTDIRTRRSHGATAHNKSHVDGITAKTCPVFKTLIPQACFGFKYNVMYTAVAGQRPRSKQRVRPLICNRRINKRSFLDNGSVNTPTTTGELLKAVFSVGSAQRLYNEDPRTAELSWKSSSGVDSWQLPIEGTNKSSARAAVTRWTERGKLKNLHC
jgi:hypothetical protein